MISQTKQPFFYTYQQYLHKERNSQRTTKQYNIWRLKVLRHYNYECAECCAKENLHVHHIKQYTDNIFLRTKISNGIVLCETCHNKEHLWLSQPEVKYILRKKGESIRGRNPQER